MTHSPVVLVYVYDCKHVSSPLAQDIWAHEVCVIPAKTPLKKPPRRPTWTTRRVWSQIFHPPWG